MSNLKDVRNKPVEIELGGKKRTLSYDLNAFAELEERYGNLEDAMQKLQKGGMKAIRTILWAGLIHEEVELDKTGEPVRYLITPYEVGSWISQDQLPEISLKLTEALSGSLPEENEALNNELKKAGFEMKDGSLVAIVPDENEKEQLAKEEHEKN